MAIKSGLTGRGFGLVSLAALLGGVCVLASACDGPWLQTSSGEGGGDAALPAAASKDFKHALSDDVSGYYQPASPVVVGKYRLTHIFLGQAGAFEGWEKGDKRSAYGPVMFEFDDGAGGTVRVKPRSYDVSDSRIRFSGHAEGVGDVSFNGQMDQGALATARRNLGEETPVMTGTLSVGGRSFGGQKFRWYGGD